MFRSAAMKYLTPPRSYRKGRKYRPSGRRAARLPYYEDVYGSLHPGEDDEGPAEQCETESDSENEAGAKFKKTPEYQRLYGSYSKQAQDRIIGNVTEDALISISSGAEESEELGERNEETSNSPTLLKSRRVGIVDSNAIYTMNPGLNRKHSLPRGEAGKHKATEYGLFVKDSDLSEDDVSEIVPFLETDGGAADDEDSESIAERRALRTFVSSRPPTIKQQLANRLAAKAEFEKAEEKARKLEEAAEKASARAARLANMAGELNRKAQRVRSAMSTRTSKSSTSLLTAKQKVAPTAPGIIGSKSSKPAAQRRAQGADEAPRKAMVVVVDHSGIDFSEYQRYE